jgi:hypothetical protein
MWKASYAKTLRLILSLIQTEGLPNHIETACPRHPFQAREAQVTSVKQVPRGTVSLKPMQTDSPYTLHVATTLLVTPVVAALDRHNI